MNGIESTRIESRKSKSNPCCGFEVEKTSTTDVGKKSKFYSNVCAFYVFHVVQTLTSVKEPQNDKRYTKHTFLNGFRAPL